MQHKNLGITIALNFTSMSIPLDEVENIKSTKGGNSTIILQYLSCTLKAKG